MFGGVEAHGGMDTFADQPVRPQMGKSCLGVNIQRILLVGLQMA